MSYLEGLKNEVKSKPRGVYCPDYYRSLGYRNGRNSTPCGRRADGIESLFVLPKPHIYINDLIVGSIRPLIVDIDASAQEQVREICKEYPERTFITNKDHYAPDYETVLSIGICGLIEKIDASVENHRDDGDALDFLSSMKITLNALQTKLIAYADHAKDLIGTDGYDTERLEFIEKNCRHIAYYAPETFAQGLQLVWMIHNCFVSEGRYAMALGRLDQYLYPLFCRDMDSGKLTKEYAVELIENALFKICENRAYLNGDDVVNVCIGGVDPDGNCAVNDLSFCVLYAVRNINMPGPNLSARITSDTPDAFLDECLKVIGTGLGYPALMNDDVNMAALRRFGYNEKDIRNYSMVGCIENFITGKQPPWSDGRFDAPRYLEYVFFDGEGYYKSRHGIKTEPLERITSMSQFMENYEKQLAVGVKDYVEGFCRGNTVSDPENYTSPFLSCFCDDCIGRAKDINMGGAVYPSVHGAALMGVGTVADSLAAIEKVVFCDREASLQNVAEAMKANFVGYEELRQKLIDAPKYGNNDQFVDKYAVWFTDYLADLFDSYRTPDGGGIYVAMAANVSNIHAGYLIGATPDGRLAEQPISDAASPTYGRDIKGATSTLLSVSKPDYSRCACGTVVNQKYSPAMFKDGKRDKLLQLIKVYFARGGQEIQINATSYDVLKDAMAHPEQYESLVVRVSGFSAFYITLNKDVQMDILSRTQQE